VAQVLYHNAPMVDLLQSKPLVILQVVTMEMQDLWAFNKVHPWLQHQRHDHNQSKCNNNKDHKLYRLLLVHNVQMNL
jgi:murein endopeptidase